MKHYGKEIFEVELPEEKAAQFYELLDDIILDLHIRWQEQNHKGELRRSWLMGGNRNASKMRSGDLLALKTNRPSTGIPTAPEMPQKWVFGKGWVDE